MYLLWERDVLTEKLNIKDYNWNELNLKLENGFPTMPDYNYMSLINIL